MAEKRQKMAGYGWKWLEWPGIAGNGWKWLEWLEKA